MPNKKDMTEETLKILCTEGLSDKAIGLKCGMTGEGVAYRRKKYGITQESKHLVTKENIYSLKSLSKSYLQEEYYSLTTGEFSEKYGVSKTVWLPYLRSLGIVSKETKRTESYPTLTDEQRRWIIGSLLGDGGISKALTYYESHCASQEKYLRHKADILKPYTSRVVPVEKNCFRFNTISHPIFKEFRDNFYNPSSKGKHIPVDYIWKWWGDEILAIWFFDDGSIDDSTGEVTIANKCPDRHNLDELVSRINKRYGWEVHSGTQGDLHRLYFPRSCRKEFGDILLRFSTSDLYYKVPEESLPRGLNTEIKHDSFYPKLYRVSDAAKKKNMEEEVFKYYRERGFPYSVLTEDRVNYMSRSFVDRNPIEDNGEIKHNTSGMALCEHFFPNMYECRREEYESPSNLWLSDEFLRKLTINRLKYSERINDAAMRRGIKLSKYCVSNFKPMIALYLFKKYCPSGTVYDYSAGFGSRMLAAMSLGLNYVACEPNTKTRENLIRFGNHLKKEIGGEFCVTPYGSESYCKGSCDFSFSSPPYFDFEKYSDESSQSIKLFPVYEDWLEGYWRATIKNIYKMLTDAGRFGVCLSPYCRQGILEKTYEIAASEGFYFEKEYKCPFKHVLGGPGKYEVVLIFSKKPLDKRRTPVLALGPALPAVSIDAQDDRKTFRKRYPEEEFDGIEEHFKKLSSDSGISRNTYKDPGINGIPVHVIERKYGSWNKFLLACGIDPQYEAQTPAQIVQDYLDICAREKEALSLYKYGKITETSRCTKMKRLFNKGKKYYYLKGRLSVAVFDKSERDRLLKEIESL